MRLKKLEIDGFKSYAKPVVVTDFDPSFNAITGLNGAGKSNCLDAICFVLGITQLKQVRATRWTDLIYKQAQAGVQKATVTATFEHNDPKHRISGFELGKDIIVRRQVVSNGRVQYTVNGSNATQQRVQDMFRSVGMNVNNPHFLIMQGKIGKVLNMNSKEILAMVEEAVGVRIYESKKINCIRTIEKKEEKMEEISKACEFESLETEVKKLRKRLCIFEYMETEKGIQKFKDEATAKRTNIEEIQEEIKNAQMRMKELENQITAMTKSKDAKMDNERKTIQSKLSDLEQIQLKKNSDVEDVQNDIKAAEQNIKSLQKSKGRSEQDRSSKQKKFEEIEKSGGEQVRLMSEAENDLKKAIDMRTALQKNKIMDEEGNEVDLNEMVFRCNDQISKLKTEITKSKADVQDLIKRIAKTEQDIAVRGDENLSDLNKRKDQFIRELNKIRAEIDKLNFDEKAAADLERSVQEARDDANRIGSRSKGFQDKYGHLFTTYNEGPGFPKDEINGSLFTLFKVKDQKFHKAVDILLGSAFPHVVVDTAECGKKILDKKFTCQRRTFLPLDEITRFPWCSDSQFDQARKICKQEVYHPKDLLEFDKKHDVVFSHFIRNAVICSNRDDAALVTEKLKIKTVTLIGEEFRPGGVTSGGIVKGRETIMEDIATYNQAAEERRNAQRRLDELKNKQMKFEEKAVKYRQLKESEENSLSSLKQIDEQLKMDLLNTWKEDLENYKKRKTELGVMIQENEMKLPEIQKKKDEFEKQKNDEKHWEKEKKKWDDLEKDARMRLKKYNVAQNMKQELDKVTDEIARLDEDIEQTNAEMDRKKTDIEGLKQKLETAKTAAKEAKEEVTAQKRTLAEYDSKLSAEEDEIKEKQAEKATINKQILELKANVETVEKAVEADEQSSNDCKKRVAEILKKNPWIATDKRYFNVPGTEFDMANFNYEENKKKLEEKAERLTEISENINPHAGNMYDDNFETVTDLQKKREQLRQDKQKLLETIKNLDERKRTEMKNAFFSVNETFGTIFSTLLNDAQAKLVPAGNGTPDNLEEGLEFRVGFNNLWKESLSELSGGQKSLVALSLILSLLKFKPAPLYILDEIDAALDISHTSNIGVLIKKQFTEAQFLIVSLKPGMFNNANAIYRAKMQDGVSTVVKVQEDVAEDDPNVPK
ncbi:hypothetical protein FO519_000802 [Halicephalobus sp. NKZ332]|nr:hypothetical protein FO519_000802 [Halicephalobus sp. NKZ332]